MLKPEDILKMGNIIAQERLTLRQMADKTGYSRSHIHQLMHNKLKIIDPQLYNTVRAILTYHNSIKHLRGGESTKINYLKKKVGAASNG